LTNGLEVLLIRNPALPMVGVNVVVKTGSAYETFATSGMSHMLEHLLFNGTTSRTQKQLYDDVDRIGGYNNANTGEYYTNFMMVTPAEHIYRGMEIQSDMLFHATLPEDKFEKEKGIVLEEIGQTLSRPAAQAKRELAAVLYPGHALALPTLGTYATIEALSRDEVLKYYRGTYVPNNMILSVIGNFDPDTMLAAIRKYYGSARPAPVYRPMEADLATGFDPLAENPLHGALVAHRFYDGDKLLFYLAYPLPTYISAEFTALLEQVLERELPALESALKSKFPTLKPALEHELQLSPVANYLLIKVSLSREDQLETLRSFLVRKMASLRWSLSPGEVADIVARNRTHFFKNLEKPHMFGIYNAYRLAVTGIDGVFRFLSPTGYETAAEQLRRFQLPDQPLTILIHPTTTTRAETAGTVETRLFTDTQAGFPLIVRRNPTGNLLAVHYLVRHKALLEAKWGRDAAWVLHDCFGQRMQSPKNREISRRYGLSFTVNDNPYIPMDDIYLHPDFGYLRVEGLADDIAGIIRYLNDQLSRFVPTEEEFEKALDARSRGLQILARDPDRDLFERTYQDILYQPEPFTADTTRLTYDRLLAFAREYFRPGNMIIAVVSPAPPDSIYRLFNALEPDGERLPVWDEPAYERSYNLPDHPVRVEKAGSGKRSYLFWGFLHEIAERDQPALTALSLILSEKIVFDVREKQGLAYRMRAGIDVQQGRALFYVRLGTRPQNVDRLLPQLPDFFTPGMVADVTEEDLEKAVNRYLGRMMFRRLSSINQAYYLGHSWYFHQDLEYDRRNLEALQTVTIEELHRVAQRYLQVANPITVIIH
jgi:predicted Zn-dependent peptidase